jgi:hypothetical protein
MQSMRRPPPAGLLPLALLLLAASPGPQLASAAQGPSISFIPRQTVLFQVMSGVVQGGVHAAGRARGATAHPAPN